GWAIPMATDIAFAVGALALLGKRVAPPLRILLLALAVIDDIGAILVIALFYSNHLYVAGFGILGLGILITFALQAIGVRSSLAYVAPAIVMWAGAYFGGIHPTLVGVLLGFMTPVAALPRGNHVDTLRHPNRETVGPAERLQHLLHRWVAFGIMPIFAFANAGVSLG